MYQKDFNTQRLSLLNQVESEIDSSAEPVKKQGEFPVEIDDEEIILESLEPHLYEVSYTCLLLPRLGSHYLLGDIADRLNTILKQTCVSFGWHLEFLSVKPDYLQWAMRVPPSTSTTYVIHVVREQTSVQIFA